MPHLEGFWIKNFRALKQCAIGSCYLQFVYVDEDLSQQQYELSPVTALIGRNGTGKSTILDAFVFIGDCMKLGVEDACLKRGGFESIYSQDSTGPLSFGFNFRPTPDSEILTYVVNIDFGAGNRPYVETELLAYRAESVESFKMPFLFFQNGEKIVRHLLTTGKISDEISQIERTDMRHLGITLLGNLRDYPIAGEVKNFFTNYYLSASQENHRTFMPPSMVPETVNPRGEGLVSLLRYCQKEYPAKFQGILNRIAAKIPNVEMIDIDKGMQNRLSLAVKKKNFSIPFYGHQLSEGFLKLLTYCCLLEEPTPVSLVGIDEPENGLDPLFLKLFLTEVFGETQETGYPQFLVATHFHELANWMAPMDVWILEATKDGFTRAQRGSDYPILRDRVRNNQPVGDSWYSDFCDQAEE